MAIDWALGKNLWTNRPDMPTTHIAKELGCTESAVRMRAKRHNWPVRMRTPRLDARDAQLALKVGVQGKSARQAAKEMGIPERTAQWRINRPEVRSAIAEYNHEVAERCRLTSERVVLEDMAIALADFAHLFDKNGYLRPIHEIPKHARAAISKIRRYQTGTGYELHNKHPSLERLHRFMGHFQRNGLKEGSSDCNAISQAVIQVLNETRGDNIGVRVLPGHTTDLAEGQD